jgi:hypothetical protein
MKYSGWQDTALVVHIITQIMGKIKLGLLRIEPEWKNTLLDLTYNGYTTGLIPYEEDEKDSSFQIDFNIKDSKIMINNTLGEKKEYKIHSKISIAEIYREMISWVSISINTKPQEMVHSIPFDEDNEIRNYDDTAANEYFKWSVFSYKVLKEFTAPFRNKTINAKYFWGTFDTTTVLYGGKEFPFSGEGIIEKNAFAENLIEFGFWPGDENFDNPAFFIMPYPFTKNDYNKAEIKPKEAYFSKEKGEFFVLLSDILKNENPKKALLCFFNLGYKILTRGEAWENCDWFEKAI